MTTNPNPRLAALYDAEEAWIELSEQMQDDGECFCPCVDPEGDWVRPDERDEPYGDLYELADADDPDAELCDCECHWEVWAAYRALTEADLEERHAKVRAAVELLRTEMAAAGASTLGELIEKQGGVAGVDHGGQP